MLERESRCYCFCALMSGYQSFVLLTQILFFSSNSISAALFLHEFVSKKTPYAHIDMAGPVWSAKSGATGWGAKLVTEWVCAVASAKKKPKQGNNEVKVAKTQTQSKQENDEAKAAKTKKKSFFAAFKEWLVTD